MTSAKEMDFMVLMGRFQPPHEGHLELALKALEKADRLIICIGSANAGRRVRNPFTVDERKEMWISILGDVAYKVYFVGLDDDLYSDVEWVNQVRHRVNRLIRLSDIEAPTVGLTGHFKDHTSSYLKYFPEWKDCLVGSHHDMSSTKIRNVWYRHLRQNRAKAPWIKGAEGVSYLSPDCVVALPEYVDILTGLTDEWHFNTTYDPTKFPVNVVTVDAVVVQNGHVLVVERGRSPGRGLLALPGGHINQNETLEAAMLRELKEETGLEGTPGAVLQSSVFDHPERSDRCRVITTAYLIKLNDEPDLPYVEGGDDAARAFWVPIGEVSPQDFFEDHAFIINKMTAGL